MPHRTFAEFETLTLTEFQTLHPGLVEGIFGSNLKDRFELSALRSARFPSDGWQVMLLPARIDHLDATFETIDDVSDDGDIDWRGSVDWMAVMLSAHWSRYVPYIFRAKVGYFETESMMRYSNEPVVKQLASSRIVTFRRPEPKTVLWSDLLVDSAGEWGLIECQDLDFSLLGAKNHLFDRFVSAFGGMDLIRWRAEYIIREQAGWQADRNPRVSPDGLNEIYLSFFRSVYDRIGWPWPFADHITMEYFGLSDD